jgi:tRNA G37 N-methylase TrmD
MWKPKGDVMKSMVVLEALQNVKARNKVLQTPSSTIYNQTLVQSDARCNDMLLLLMHGGDDRIMSYCNARLARLARL